MSFLAPLFLIGLAAIAVPIFVHLIQRERRNTVAFPSLMFIRRIPYQSVERRRIHNWPLLLLRLAALVLIVAAFSRPFFTEDRCTRRRGIRGPRCRHPARSVGEHGLRRPLGARPGRGDPDRRGPQR